MKDWKTTPIAGVLSTLVLALGIAAPAEALPLISEVVYDAVGADDGSVFVELYGAPGALLDGLTLIGVNGSDGATTVTLELTGAIPADGFFVIADSISGGGSNVMNADLLLNFDFQNGPDAIQLLDAGGAVLDALGYGVFGAGTVFGGEGSPAPDPAAGQSLARVFANIDTDNNLADFVALATPTPGTGVLPEPNALALVGLALGALAGARRRP